MNLNQLISKIPKTLLVFGVLTIALVMIIINNPLKDECEVKTNIFLKEMHGIINSVRVKKDKVQYAQLTFWKKNCQEANSLGACEDYLTGLSKLTKALAVFPEQCQINFIEENEGFVATISEALQIMALIAWGDHPPAGPSERFGWLTETDLKTFCRLKSTFLFFTSEEELHHLRDRVYIQYPDSWPKAVPFESRKPEYRPKALKTLNNPSGTLDKNKIYERSLFSIRCDLYQ